MILGSDRAVGFEGRMLIVRFSEVAGSPIQSDVAFTAYIGLSTAKDAGKKPNLLTDLAIFRF